MTVVTTANFTRDLDPAVAARIAMERKVISCFVKKALQYGNKISIHNGEEICLNRSTSYKAIMAAIMSTDEENLIVTNEYNGYVGSVFCVYGNDGWDVFADYSVSLEFIMEAGPNALIDQLSGSY